MVKDVRRCSARRGAFCGSTAHAAFAGSTPTEVNVLIYIYIYASDRSKKQKTFSRQN